MSEIVAVYADGGVIDVNPSPIGGTYAWVHVDAADLHIAEGSGLITPAEIGVVAVSNNLAEFYALLSALEALPAGWSGRVCSDSGVTLGRFFAGWKQAGIPLDWWKRGGAALQRLGRLEPVQLDGHPTKAQLLAGRGRRGHLVSKHNVWADAECGRVALKARKVSA